MQRTLQNVGGAEQQTGANNILARGENAQLSDLNPVAPVGQSSLAVQSDHPAAAQNDNNQNRVSAAQLAKSTQGQQ